MNEIFDNITNNYTYIDSNEIDQYNTTIALTGLTSSASNNISINNISSSTNHLCIGSNTNTITVGQGIYTTGINTNSININLNGIDIRENLIKNILDRIIEIKSLTNKNLYEIFNIKNINYLKNKTKIICFKEVNLEYIDDLKNESKLLNEFIDVPIDNYKEKAIITAKNKLSTTYLDFSGTGLIWAGTDQNTITINNPNLVWGTQNNLTYNFTCTNQNNITYTA